MMLERDANAEDEEKKWGTRKFKYLIQITNLWKKLGTPNRFRVIFLQPII